MTLRKFLFGGLLVIVSIALAAFLVRCSFVPIETLSDPKETKEITAISTMSTTTETVTSEPETTTEESTSATLETTVFEDVTTVLQTLPVEETIVIHEVSAIETTVFQTECEVTTTSIPIYVDYPVDDKQVKIDMGFRGSFYTGGWCTKGGSGRTLLPYNTTDEIRGSVASYYLWSNYKYDLGGRTKVYIEVPQFPEMNGYYYLDDCCDKTLPTTIDFFCYESDPCPLMLPVEKPVGVTFDIQCWIVEE